MKLFVDMANVSVNRGVGEAHFIGDFLVEIPFGKEIEHLEFAGRQIIRISRSREWSLERLDDFARDVAAHWRTAAMDITNSREQLGGRSLLQQITRRAGSQGIKNVLGVLIHREHDELSRRQKRFEPANAFHAAEAGQIDIHQNDVRAGLREFLHGSFRGGVLGEAAKARRVVDEFCEAGTNASIVFNNGNGDAHKEKSENRNSKSEGRFDPERRLKAMYVMLRLSCG